MSKTKLTSTLAIVQTFIRSTLLGDRRLKSRYKTQHCFNTRTSYKRAAIKNIYKPSDYVEKGAII